MKYLMIFAVAMLIGCAPNNQPTAWNMTWQCFDVYCATHIVPNAWSGSGSFSNETDCLAWETGFLNTAAAGGQGSVSACTAN